MTNKITPELFDFGVMTTEEKHEYERRNSSLFRKDQKATYNQCRKYACESIANGMTKISVKYGEIIEIPYGVPYNFIGRVSTSIGYDKNTPNEVYEDFETRDFISFTTICNTNKSHYKGEVFYLYNIRPQDIVHIFPMDSNTMPGTDCEEELTKLPSLWITLDELQEVTHKLEVYNQVTCRTKRYGKSQIIKPFAIAAFDKVSEKIMETAELFKIGIVLIHPNGDAINYDQDLLFDWFELKRVSEIMKSLYGFSVTSLYYSD